MVQEITAEDQVIDILLHTRTCDLEEIMRRCSNLTWNQVFLAVDRLSRNGKIMLMPRGRGLYALTFPHTKKVGPDYRSPSS